jgi:hypothetical protein
MSETMVVIIKGRRFRLSIDEFMKRLMKSPLEFIEVVSW